MFRPQGAAARARPLQEPTRSGGPRPDPSRLRAGPARTARANGRKTISISCEHLFQHSNIHDFGRYADLDLALAADAETTLPSLIEEIRRLITPGLKAGIEARGARVAAAHKATHVRAVEDARHGWDASPISVPRLIAELGAQIKSDDWAIVSGHQFTGDWQRRLLNFDKHYRYNGDSGGMGIGYDSPASVGAPRFPTTRFQRNAVRRMGVATAVPESARGCDEISQGDTPVR